MPRPATRAELADLTAPACVIAAEKDLMFPGGAVTERAREIIPNLAVVECLKGATHLSTQSDMDHVNQRIGEFLEVTN